MKSEDMDRITDWIIRSGLAGLPETDLLRLFCEKCNAAGVPVARTLAFIDTLHPVNEGTIYRWRNDDVEENAATDYARTDTGEAALWFSDLRSFTTITDTAKPSEIIPLLNDYADAVITSVHEAGGDVLKLIGDGILAMFRADDPSEACRCALQAEAIARKRVSELNERRSAQEQPTTAVYVGLHVGEVFFGNIGSVDRLDFTVVGPAVNETSRIASMCRSVDRPMLVSSTFADVLPEADRADLVSVGRFALRGVGRAKELFTRDPGLVA